jgi:hypothetical protein
MSNELTRREFLVRAAIGGAAVVAFGAGPDALAQTTNPQTRDRVTVGTKNPRKLALAPDLVYAKPDYNVDLETVRVLSAWNPSSREFLVGQHRFSGKIEPGNFFVVTLRNRSEGAAFDTVVEIFVLVADYDRKFRLREVLKFERLGQVFADVPPNRMQDFAVPITWTNADAWRIPPEKKGGSASYVARYWHPIFDHAPQRYVQGERHFWHYAVARLAVPR